MDWSQIIQLAPELAITAVFIWFSSNMNKAAAEDREKQDVRHQAERKEWMDRLEKMDTEHRQERKEFLDALRQNTQAIQSISKQ